MADYKPYVITAPPLPIVKFDPGPSKTNVATPAKSGFDVGGLFDGLFGTIGKYLEYQTARVNGSGGGQIVYQPATAQASTAGSGFDFSNPIVLIAGAGLIYLLTKSSDKKQ